VRFSDDAKPGSSIGTFVVNESSTEVTVPDLLISGRRQKVTDIV
jgi:hypothetical protein